MAFKWRKWNRAMHRDFGYLFFGMTIIYCISGIAINHIGDWDPNYVITTQEIEIEPGFVADKASIKALLSEHGLNNSYKKHYFPDDDRVKVFINQGSLIIDLEERWGLIEQTKKRFMIKGMNYLHYDPGKWWTWVSDIFAGALILLAISGILIPRGDKGITRRGLWMTAIGIIFPIVFYFMLIN